MDAVAAADAAARDGQTALVLRLAKHLAPPPPGAGADDGSAATAAANIAFSPVSVHAALALAAAGARRQRQTLPCALLPASMSLS